MSWTIPKTCDLDLQGQIGLQSLKRFVLTFKLTYSKFASTFKLFIDHTCFFVNTKKALTSSRDVEQMVSNYKRVVKGLGCMTITGLGFRVRLGIRFIGQVKVKG